MNNHCQYVSNEAGETEKFDWLFDNDTWTVHGFALYHFNICITFMMSPARYWENLSKAWHIHIKKNLRWNAFPLVLLYWGFIATARSSYSYYKREQIVVSIPNLK